MYAGASRFGLGVMELCDTNGSGDPTMIYDDASGCWYPADDSSGDAGPITSVDPIAITPTTINTSPVPTTAPVLIQPMTVSPGMTPQQLPTIVSTVSPAPSSTPAWLLPALLIGGLYLAFRDR